MFWVFFLSSRKVIFCRFDRTIRSVKHHLRGKGDKGGKKCGIWGDTSSICHKYDGGENDIYDIFLPAGIYNIYLPEGIGYIT